MRISNLVVAAVTASGLSLGIGPTLPFDGGPPPSQPQAAAFDALRGGNRAALKFVEKDKIFATLQYAAENGHAMAQWKLGRMYADGDGVAHDDLKAFEYFRKCANTHADDNPDQPQARFVANSFVALGGYYLTGIADSDIKPDPEHARQMYGYAASYFGDGDAQYHLARLYLDGSGGVKDPRQAVRWLVLAANKGQYEAQALLGRMLFKGEHVPRQAARGLMWLTLASDSASVKETWITELHDEAFDEASDEERARALRMLEHWMRSRRE